MTDNPFAKYVEPAPAPAAEPNPFAKYAEPAAPMGAGAAVAQGAAGGFKQTVANVLTSIGSMPNPGGMMGSWAASTPIYREQKTPQEQQAQAKALFSPMAKEGAAQVEAAKAAHPVLGQAGAFAGMAPAYLAPQTILASELGSEIQNSDRLTAGGLSKALGKTALFSALPFAHQAAAPVLKATEGAVADQILAKGGNLVVAKVGAKLVVGTGEAAVGQEAILGGMAAIDQDASMYDPTNPEAYSMRAAGLLLGGAGLGTRAIPEAAKAGRASRLGEQTVSAENARQFEAKQAEEQARLPGEAAALGVEAPGITTVPTGKDSFVLRSTTGQPIGSRELPGLPSVVTPEGATDISTGTVPNSPASGLAPDTGAGIPAVSQAEGVAKYAGIAPRSPERAKAIEAKANQAEAEAAAPAPKSGEFFPQPYRPKFSQLPTESEVKAPPEPAVKVPEVPTPPTADTVPEPKAAVPEAAPAPEKVELAVRRGGKAKPVRITPEHIEGNDSFFIAHNDKGEAVTAQYIKGKGDGAKPLTVTEALGNPEARVRPVRVIKDPVTGKNTIEPVGEVKEVKALWTTPKEALKLANQLRDEKPVARQAAKETKADAATAKEAATYDTVEAAKGVIERYEAAPIKTRADEEAHFAKEKPADLQSFLTHGDVREADPVTAKKVLTPHVREMVTHARDAALNRQESGTVSQSDARNSGLSITKEQHAAGSVGDESGGHKVAPVLITKAAQLVGEGADMRIIDDNTLKLTTPNGHSITFIRDTTGHLPKGTLGSVRTEVVGDKTQSVVHLHPNASPGVLAHEIGHIKLDHFLNPNERKLLLSRITDAQVKKTLAKYEAAGIPVSEAKAREEAALDRLKDYENHGVLERSIWQRLNDFAKEIAKHFGLGEGSERQIMDQMLGGEFFKRTARAADSETSYSLPDEGREKKPARASWNKRLAQTLRTLPIEEPARRFQERIAGASEEKKAAYTEVADTMKTSEAIALQRTQDGQPIINKALMHARVTPWAELKDAHTVDAPEGDGVAHNSAAYDALYNGKKATGAAKVFADTALDATKLTNGWYRESGIPASGNPPHVGGRDFGHILSGVDEKLTNTFYKVVAEAQPKLTTIEEVRDHYSNEAVNKTDSNIRIANAEVEHRFENLPQFIDSGGRRYEVFTTDPERVTRSIIENSAHRSAYVQVYGRGTDVRGDMADVKGLKHWATLSAAEKDEFRNWSRTFHGSSLGMKFNWNNRSDAVRYAGDIAGGVLGIAKDKALITAAPGNVIGILGNIALAGVRPTARAIGKMLSTPRKEIEDAQRLGLVDHVLHGMYDPSSRAMTAVKTTRNGVGFINRAANVLADTTSVIAANDAFDSAQAAARKGKPDRDYQTMLRSMGFTPKEITDATENGAATPQMRAEIIQRSVANATGRNAIRGQQAPWVNYWVTKKLGPAFTSWADAQLKRRVRLLADMVEGNPRAFKVAASDVTAMLGVGALTATYWAFHRGGAQGVQQENERDDMARIHDYLISGYGGGIMQAMGMLGSGFSSGASFENVAKAVSFPVSAYINERDAIHDAWNAMSNGEGMVSALATYGTSSTPILQRTSDALAWMVEDKNPGTLNKATSLFRQWQKDHPEFGALRTGGASATDTSTTIALDRALRAIKQGDAVDPALAVRLGFASAEDAKKPTELRQAILSHRLITKIRSDLRPQALAQIRADLGPITIARLQRHDQLIESLADTVAPKLIE